MLVDAVIPCAKPYPAASAALPPSLFAQAQDNAQRLDQFRKQFSGPTQVSKVSGNVYMLSRAGGNIGLITGPEGKIVIDSGVLPASSGILEALGKIDATPLKYLINTHWHFDHTDGNAKFHEAGATIVATARTRDQLSTPQSLDPLNLHFPASPAAARPTRTLTAALAFYHEGELVLWQVLPLARTDTDLYVYFENAEVIHAGDVFFTASILWLVTRPAGL
jgi:glyoxylase-like metal-dependent hydrolase (beta-lactamase superfamily II)